MIMNLKKKQILFGMGVLLLILIIGLRQIIDIDIWWHIKVGDEILRNFGSPDFSQFYFSPINPEIQDLRFTWLGDILFSLVFKIAGEWGLQIFRMILMAVAAAMLWDMHGRSPSSLLFLMVGFLFLCTYQIQLMRNALFSLPLLTGLFWLWWKVRFQGQEKALWWIPVLLTCWGFLHGTFLLGAGLFFFLVAGETYGWLAVKAPDGKVNPSKKSQKSGKKKRESDPALMDLEADSKIQWQKFHLLRNRYLALFLAFVGTVSFNPYAIDKVRSILGDMWWLVILLGLVLVAVIFLHKGVSTWVIRKRPALYLIARFVLVLVVFTFIGWITIRSMQPHAPLVEVDLRDPLAQQTTLDEGFLIGLKRTLNSLIFTVENKMLISTDFLSPWDNLNEIYISLSFILGLIILIVFMVLRPIPPSLIFTFFPVMILSFGYKRTAGYLGMVSIFFILMLIQIRKIQWGKNWLWIFNGLAVVFLAAAVFFFPQKAGLWQTHVPGFGRAPYFSTACAENILEKEGAAPVFTNIRNGGFLLHRWFPHKRVFVDGFFAPHKGEAFDSYNNPLIERRPDLFVQKYGIHRAIVTHRDLAWLSLFSSSRNWYPESIDQGMLVFVYEPDWEMAPQPAVLLTLQEFEDIPNYFKPMFANRFLEIPASLIAKGRVKQAREFLEENEELVTRTKLLADPMAVEQLTRNLQVAQDKYNGENSLFLYYELELQNGVRRGDAKRVLEFGSKIWEEQPGIDLGFQLIGACLALGEIEKTVAYLDGTQKILDDVLGIDEHQMSEHQKALISSWQRLAQLCENAQRFSYALDALWEVSQLNPRLLSQVKLMHMGLDYYRQLRESREIFKAYDLLLKMREDFPKSPFVLHNLSIHVFENHEALGLGLDQAESFAAQAVALAEIAPIPRMDFMYKNLADLLLERGETEKAEFYLSKARAVAPDDRKGLYESKK